MARKKLQKKSLYSLIETSDPYTGKKKETVVETPKDVKDDYVESEKVSKPKKESRLKKIVEICGWVGIGLAGIVASLISFQNCPLPTKEKDPIMSHYTCPTYMPTEASTSIPTAQPTQAPKITSAPTAKPTYVPRKSFSDFGCVENLRILGVNVAEDSFGYVSKPEESKINAMEQAMDYLGKCNLPFFSADYNGDIVYALTSRLHDKLLNSPNGPIYHYSCHLPLYEGWAFNLFLQDIYEHYSPEGERKLILMGSEIKEGINIFKLASDLKDVGGLEVYMSEDMIQGDFKNDPYYLYLKQTGCIFGNYSQMMKEVTQN